MKTTMKTILTLAVLLTAPVSAHALGNGTPGNPMGLAPGQMAALAPAAGGPRMVTGLGANDFQGGAGFAAMANSINSASGNTGPRPVTGLGANAYNPSR